MIYKNSEIFQHGLNDGLYGYTYLNPKWNQENLKDYSNGLIIGKIQLSIKENNFLNCTYELMTYCYLIHIWIKNSYKSLNFQVDNKSDFKKFKELTGIKSIKRQY